VVIGNAPVGDLRSGALVDSRHLLSYSVQLWSMKTDSLALGSIRFQMRSALERIAGISTVSFIVEGIPVRDKRSA
jgi:hypothetical protein